MSEIPKDIDLEQEVLATILDNPGTGLCQELREEDFTFPQNRIFGAIRALDAGKGLTHARLRNELEKADLLESVGGNKMLADLQATTPLPVGGIFRDSVRRLQECAKRREGLQLAERISRKANRMDQPFSLEEFRGDLEAGVGCNSFYRTLQESALNGEEFMTRKFPERRALIGDWFCEGDLGFVFAPRGVGKTWFVHHLVAALTAGRDACEWWKVPEAVPVCLVDGEMPPDAVQERLGGLKVVPSNLTVLSHQCLFDHGETNLQLGNEEHRQALLDFCVEKEIRVLVIDNLSSLSSIKENDNDEWQELGNWLLDFRRKGIAVVVVHHSGRNGQMRGASRREDPAFWIIKLDDSKARTGTEEGARFISTFTKNRNSQRWPTPIDWHFLTGDHGEIAIETHPAGTEELVYQCIVDGLDRCSDIAEELGLSKGTVSKAAASLRRDERIVCEGKGNQARYRLAGYSEG